MTLSSLTTLPSKEELEGLLRTFHPKTIRKMQDRIGDPYEADRQLAISGLGNFTRRMVGLDPARHHAFVNAHLEKAERREIKRLMIFEPPGHAKSTYASWMFPAWYIGRNPTHNIIIATHTADFSRHWGRKVRNLIVQDEWPFHGVGLAADSKDAGDWETNKGGRMFTTGFGGNVTGRRGDFLLIDDPVKSREDADSQTIRNKTWEAYKSDFRTRLKPDAVIVIVQTRWHEDDLSGRILPEDYDGRSGWIESRDGEEWFVISLPALAEENDILGREYGEALWPEWYAADRLLAEKLAQGERNWAALYQQRPSPIQGAFFKREDLRFYDKAPRIETLRLYGFSDYAVTDESAGADPDYTVHGVVGLDPNDDIYVLDWYRARVDTDKGVDAWLAMVGQWKPVKWGYEKALVEKSVLPFMTRRMKEQGAYVALEAVSASRVKEMKAQAIKGRMGQGKVYLPQNAPWVADLVTEVMSFPSGTHDDQVDVLSGFGRLLDVMRPRDDGYVSTRVVRSFENKRKMSRLR